MPASARREEGLTASIDGNARREIDLDALDPATVPLGRLPSERDPSLGVALAHTDTAIWVAAAVVDQRNIGYWRKTGLDVNWIKADEQAIANLIDRIDRPEPAGDVGLDPETEQAPVSAWVHATLSRAVDEGASDVHFEPDADRLRVRCRVDGVLHTFGHSKQASIAAVIARLKVMARLDTAERRLPQDGRATLASAGIHHDLRISTLPTTGGEKVVVRILSAATTALSLGQLGLFSAQRRMFMRALARPQGMVLVTGPTGSGKTATLYAALDHLNETGRNLATVEDPVEIRVDGINQVQVDEKIGMTFAKALRALLRQDPDILMIGEIRDAETADIAVKAAQTGHLVLATLHSNSAIDAITRLRGLGIAASDISACVTLVIAQRLVRLLCGDCKERLAVADSAPSSDNTFQASANGCFRCLSGFRHRRGIYELLPLAPKTEGQSNLRTGGVSATGPSPWHPGANQTAQPPSMAIDDLTIARDETLWGSGMARVRRGETSLAELERVLGHDVT